MVFINIRIPTVTGSPFPVHPPGHIPPVLQAHIPGAVPAALTPVMEDCFIPEYIPLPASLPMRPE